MFTSLKCPAVSTYSFKKKKTKNREIIFYIPVEMKRIRPEESQSAQEPTANGLAWPCWVLWPLLTPWSIPAPLPRSRKLLVIKDSSGPLASKNTYRTVFVDAWSRACGTPDGEGVLDLLLPVDAHVLLGNADQGQRKEERHLNAFLIQTLKLQGNLTLHFLWCVLVNFCIFKDEGN